MNETSVTSTAKYWAVVPAAGVGKRMGADRPKQYLPLAGKRVIEHTLARLASHPRIAKIVVAIGAEDDYWREVRLPEQAEVQRVEGGAKRCHSVFNGLEAIKHAAGENDWVLVHDAARPCLRVADIEHLITTLVAHPVGGILGIPVADTMKRSRADGTIVETVCRDNLWRAVTPQMFRFGMLYDALGRANRANALITDEASAIEWAGLAPRMVEGRADNIKITQPQDLKLAELFLQQQKEEIK